MPIKIKPVRDLGPCTLDLDGIKGICSLLDKEFKDVRYIAEDDIWSVFDEPCHTFIEAISQREKLDGFTAETPPFLDSSRVRVEADFIENLIIHPTQENNLDSQLSASQSSRNQHGKKIKLVFNREEAKVIFDIQPQDQDWLDHFLLDLNKFFSPPTLLQKFGGFPLPLMLVDNTLVISFEQPRCHIFLKKKEPNQRLIGIGDDIIASLFYDFLKFIVAAIVTLIAAWILRQFGVDILGMFGGS